MSGNAFFSIFKKMLYFIKTPFFILSIFLFFFGNTIAIAQDGFKLPKGKKVDRVPFKFVNNLIIVPVELNGIKMSFLLDTGVDKTFLFVANKKDVKGLRNTKKRAVRGWGEETAKDGLVSTNNTMKIGGAKDINHTVYVIYDDTIDFSKYMGVDINGVIGYEYFKNFEVTIKYASKRIITRNSSVKSKKLCRKCDQLSIDFYNNKAHVLLNVNNDTHISMLLDTGSSDAIWLFDSSPYLSEFPKNYFKDFLGYTLTGNIYGKRSYVDSVTIGKFRFESVSAAFPENVDLQRLNIKKGRKGSIGGGVLSRFTTTIDYRNAVVTLKKNSLYKTRFNYDLTGISLIYEGWYAVKDEQKEKKNEIDVSFSYNNNNEIPKRDTQTRDDFQTLLVPRLVIASLRDNSPAKIAGLEEGDTLIKINGINAYKYELNKIITLFRSEVGKKIIIEYERNNILLKTSFRLQKLL